MLNNREKLRYQRHLVLPEIGVEGQQKLKTSKVVIVGAGGLGSPAAIYLTSAGVGTIGIVDDDRVSLNNLQRQILYNHSDIGKLKTFQAKARLQSLNDRVKVQAFTKRLNSDNAASIIKHYDIVIDGTDNFPTRYLINDICVRLKKPFIYGSVMKFEGQVSFFGFPGGPCYRCLFPEPPPEGLIPGCAESGILGVLPGVIGIIQATEAIKYLLGRGELLAGRLLLYDALKMKFRQVIFKKNKECPLCGKNKSLKKITPYQQTCDIRTPQSKSIPSKKPSRDLSAKKLKTWLESGRRFALIDVREPSEYKQGHIPGAKNIPLGAIVSSSGRLAKAKEIVVHCQLDERAERAVQMLQSSGYANIKKLQGGYAAWRSINYGN